MQYCSSFFYFLPLSNHTPVGVWLSNVEGRFHLCYLVFTNTPPGEIVYEDHYQIAVKVSGELQIEKLQESWSPKD